MTIVYWTPFCEDIETHEVQFIHSTFEEPVPFLNYIAQRRDKSAYLKCPAVFETYKNTFVIKAPIDMRVVIDTATNYVSTSLSQTLYDRLCMNRSAQRGETDPYILTLPPSYLFYSEESMIMESRPMMLERPSALENVHSIPGSYDIGKWRRPIDFTLEVIDASKPIEIKRGDPLFCVKFDTPDGSKVTFERVPLTKELIQQCAAITSLKFVIPGQPLKTVYDMVASYMAFLNRKGK